jgi:hypothetical protein
MAMARVSKNDSTISSSPVVQPSPAHNDSFPISTPFRTRIPPHGIIMEHKKSLESPQQQQKTSIQADDDDDHYSTDQTIFGTQNRLSHGSVIVIVDRATNSGG